LGSHRWNKNIGNLTKNAKIKAAPNQSRPIHPDFLQQSVYHGMVTAELSLATVWTIPSQLILMLSLDNKLTDNSDFTF
jgi:hypothetical protein